MDRTAVGKHHPDTTQSIRESSAFNDELYRDPGGQAVQQARLRVTHSPCKSFITFFAPASINMPLTNSSLTTQIWTLKESGALCSWDRVKNSPSPLWKSCETNPYYSEQSHNSQGTVSFIRNLQTNTLNNHLGDLLKNSEI